MNQHLLVAITPHGFGHAAQVIPVVNVLHGRRPDLRISIETQLPESLLRERVKGEFEYRAHATDFGLHMDSSLDFRLEDSAQSYAQLHDRWEQLLAEERTRLQRLDVDLLLADVPYLPLQAAHQLAIPAVALCSLNWADIYRHYFSARPQAETVLEQMEHAYGSARYFVQPQPSMPMDGLPNRIKVGPIAALGRDLGASLRAHLGLKPGQRLVLLAPGGVATGFNVDRWPRDTGLHCIVTFPFDGRHPNVSTLEGLPFAFIELLRSVDAVVGKLGYGTVAECACNGAPLLYMPRPQWPEEPYLLRWLQDHGRCAPVTRAQVEQGSIGEVLEQCLGQSAPVVPLPTGAEETADLLLEMLG